MSQDDDTRRWKQKYYDNLEQLESKEKQWCDVESLLRRGIARLSLAAGGADPTLDRELETLRNALRDGRDSITLRSVIESVGDSVARLDQRRPVVTRQPAVTDSLIQLLDDLVLPRGMGRKAKALHKKLRAHKPPADSAPLVRELVGLLQEALSFHAVEDVPSSHLAPPQAAAMPQVAARESGGEEGVLRRLWGRRPKHKQDVTPVEAETTLPPASEKLPVPPPATGNEEILQSLLDKLPLSQDRVFPLQQRVAKDMAQSELECLLDDIVSAVRATYSTAQNVMAAAAAPELAPQATTSELLIQLVELLHLPEELAEQSDAVRQQLEEGALAGQPERALEAIAALVLEARTQVQREKDEIEAFLTQLTVRLQELDVHLQSTESARVETRQSGVELDRVVQVQIHGMESGIHNTIDVDQLKQIIQERIDAVRVHLERHHHEEEARSARVDQQMQQLTQKLEGLEAEADILHARIAHEHELAFKDGLTEIHNRLAYLERIAQEHERWKRYQYPLTLLIWDVDRFKSVNDIYGHRAGDKALKTIADILQENLRATDFLARYGGEEFVIVMPSTTLSDAFPVAEKLRAAIEVSGFHYREQHVPITISCGIAGFRDDDTPETVFGRADSALYRAKKAGGNQCIADQ